MPDASPKPRSHAHLVLVVEDNIDANFITTSTLQHFGYEVMKAENLHQARQLTQSRRPDVVVLDCRLPDGDGLELAREWRGDVNMKNVPIICLTAFSARQDMEAALLAGVDAFLVKPVPSSMLTLQIEKALAGSHPSQTLRAQRPGDRGP